MLQHFIIQFPLYYLLSGCLWEVENKRKFQTFSSYSICNVVVLAYERSGRLIIRGSKYGDLT